MSTELTGTVKSEKNDKTIVVSVDRRKMHPLYRKQYTISKSFQVHDEKNEAKVGDKVRITESRPISKTKHFVLAEVIRRKEGSV